MANFEVSLSFSPATAAVTFEPVPVQEGVRCWSDQEWFLVNAPPCLVGGTLFRTNYGGIPAGTAISLTLRTADVMRVYCIVEVARPEGVAGRDGGWCSALSKAPCWLAEGCAGGHWDGEADNPSKAATTGLFSVLAQRHVPLQLPTVSTNGAILAVVAVPVRTGTFAVALAASSSTVPGAMPNFDQMAIMEEGVTAWHDRDHRYVDVPVCLVGGVLFQGPYRDVPEGTVLNLRPNARARAFVIFELSCSGGFQDLLPAAGWEQEEGAPRWHETPTMRMYSRDCAAGRALTLPATRGSSAVISIVVVPAVGTSVAPVEVSCGLIRGGLKPGAVEEPDAETEAKFNNLLVKKVASLDIVPMVEGTPCCCEGEGKRLSKVPLWMVGAALVRFPHSGAPAEVACSIRPAAPSVIYAILETTGEQEVASAANGSTANGTGATTADCLLSSGWERREEAPELVQTSHGASSGGGTSTLAVFARRIPSLDALGVLPLATNVGKQRLLCVVAKVDVEAFDAIAETNDGLEYGRAVMVETAIAWIDAQHRFTWVPTFMNGGVLFRGPHCLTASGTVVRISASSAFRAYVIVEAQHKNRDAGARHGGFVDSLPRAGWMAEIAAPSWGDTASVMKVFSRLVPDGETLLLPPTVGEVIFSIVVVDVAASAERILEELKRVFKAWDPQGKGGISRTDLEALLQRLPGPSLGSEARRAMLDQADRRGTGKIGWDELIGWIVSSGGGSAAPRIHR
eukprot:gnl/TRDRNA2_/TRDRNA2_130936_c0_seq2.p1 gnl/TRDRNA2_/TRDRNA2_130936_c0~~gnl/TRDRNA2_/TRDRNA2_130936_c0_seq2.p1  ORF type:complete len:740 (+),score=121.07 gnl/TRDRNA2_/TRDRNA2_130936_c0_seq2:68-2287(+)